MIACVSRMIPNRLPTLTEQTGLFLYIPRCSDYNATTMINIPHDQWKTNMPANRLDEAEARYDVDKYKAAMKSH